MRVLATVVLRSNETVIDPSVISAGSKVRDGAMGKLAVKTVPSPSAGAR